MSGVEHKAEKENKGELGLACFFLFFILQTFSVYRSHLEKQPGTGRGCVSFRSVGDRS